jgi:hypothetical protein
MALGLVMFGVSYYIYNRETDRGREKRERWESERGDKDGEGEKGKEVKSKERDTHREKRETNRSRGREKGTKTDTERQSHRRVVHTLYTDSLYKITFCTEKHTAYGMCDV